MKKTISNTDILKWFLIEDYRMFDDLFGSRRLMLFPLSLLAIGIGLGASAPLFDADPRVLVGILLSVVGFFGIQTGSIGFEARDTVDNMLGDSSRILFSSKTLPISQKRMAGVFLIKDFVVYSVLVLIPTFIGIATGYIFSPISTGLFVPTFSQVAISYVLVTLSFTAGASIGFILTTVSVNRLGGVVGGAVLVLVAAGVGLYSTTVDVYAVRAVELALFLAASTVLFSTSGLWQFNATTNSRSSSTYTNRMSTIVDRIGDDKISLLLGKTILDIFRTSGGVWKIFFSTGIISVSIVLLIKIVETFMQTAIVPPVLFAGLFSISAFPVYALVYRYDSDDSYSRYPISESDVRIAKSVAFLLLGSTIIGIYYTIACIIYGASFLGYLTGVVVLLSLLTYQLGVLIHMAKDEPMKFLFDGVMFSGYSLSMMVVMIPIAMSGMFGLIIPSYVTITAYAVCVSVGLLGLFIVKRSIYNS